MRGTEAVPFVITEYLCVCVSLGKACAFGAKKRMVSRENGCSGTAAWLVVTSYVLARSSLRLGLHKTSILDL